MHHISTAVTTWQCFASLSGNDHGFGRDHQKPDVLWKAGFNAHRPLHALRKSHNQTPVVSRSRVVDVPLQLFCPAEQIFIAHTSARVADGEQQPRNDGRSTAS